MRTLKIKVIVETTGDTDHGTSWDIAEANIPEPRNDFPDAELGLAAIAGKLVTGQTRRRLSAVISGATKNWPGRKRARRLPGSEGGT